MPLASDIRLPERYRVTRHIASGGMASVWEVEDLLLGRVVAVKLLGAQYAADPGARARFQREARTAARVSDHPNIATIYDIGEHGEDAFIVMEYFSGGTVADRLRTAADGGGRVPRETALRWLREAAGGLDHAHAAGVVHRDVKPANLLLDAQDRLAVGDFGIARLADDTSMTQTGQVLGTAAYLSPEQATGGSATAASDRYAFAVVAYELLTGGRPFAGGPPSAQVRQHAEADPVAPTEAEPGLPAELDDVFARALAKEPGARPATAAGLVGGIERALRPVEQTERTQALTPVVPLGAAAAQRAAAADPAQAAEPAEEPPEEPPTPPARERRSPPPPAAATPPRRARRISPLVPIGLAAALAAVVLAIALGRGGEDPQRSAAKPTTGSTAARTQPTTSAPAPAAEEQPAAPPAQAPPAEPSGESPAALNDRGFALNQDGRYAEAVAPLRAAVEGYRKAGNTDDIGYAYALYNLGVALNRSGDPAAAVEVLEERMRYSNQRGTVQRELRDARSKLDGGDRGGAKQDKDKDKHDDD
ncbi:MAG TPA: serine/threonine-protein kinase [Solirubrobacteraceae bacterium]|nr:serine/threonine-protein kinase [Solirubrobacteraceae bacterium]